MTTQFGEHEAIEVYGNGDEYSAAKARDPIPKFRAILIARGFLTDADAQKIETAARTDMDDAVNYALASPLPAPEEATNHIFA